MQENSNPRASFVSRILVVFAATISLIFATFVVLENRELNKVVPATPTRNIAMFCGYIVVILVVNYIHALRGNNLIDWKTELLVSLNFVLFFGTATLPSLLPLVTESNCEWWNPFCKVVRTESPNEAYYYLAFLQVPLLAFTAYRVRAHFRTEPK